MNSDVTNLAMLLNGLIARYKHIRYRFMGRRGKFTAIYNAYGFGGESAPLSGTGSTLSQTKIIRGAIPALFRKYHIKSLVDAPCGDFTWMKEVELDGINYIGVDIVDDLIEDNEHLYRNDHCRFISKDIATDKLPLSDLILCRDCFIHLSNSDIKRSIINFKLSGATYLLTTTFQNIDRNKNMVTGRGWRPVNLEIAPFNFPVPLEIINEESTEEDGRAGRKSLGLWRLDSL
jgi:hypothetical protein